MIGSGPFAEPPIELQVRSILASLPDDDDGLRRACLRVDDWSALFSAAHEHGVADLVVDGAQRAGVALPRAALEVATQRSRMNCVWNDVLGDALRSVLRLLREAEIPAVVLKGPVLAARLYGERTVRPSTDLDLLVDPALLDAAGHTLRSLGYVVEGGRGGRFFRNHHHHVHALHPTLPALELHFDAYRGFGTVLPAAPLLGRSMPCLLSGWSDARVLAPEDEFLYLAVHAASHRFQRLIWLLDLKFLALRHPHLRWDDVAARAKAHGLSAVVSFACALLSRWMGMSPYGSAQLPQLNEARATVAAHLARRQSIHMVNAAVDFLFCGLLCDDLARAAEFSRRFVRVKLLHEVPLRAMALFSS
jgi:hypothetical protein